MSQTPYKKPGPGMGAWLLAGFLTVVTAVLGLAEWLLSRTLIRDMLVLGKVSPWAWSWWENAGFVVIAIVWLALVYLSAYWYQQALPRGRLWHTFGLVSAVQVGVPLVVLAIVFGITRLT